MKLADIAQCPAMKVLYRTHPVAILVYGLVLGVLLGLLLAAMLEEPVTSWAEGTEQPTWEVD